MSRPGAVAPPPGYYIFHPNYFKHLAFVLFKCPLNETQKIGDSCDGRNDVVDLCAAGSS